MTYAFHTPDKLCFILDLMNGGAMIKHSYECHHFHDCHYCQDCDQLSTMIIRWPSLPLVATWGFQRERDEVLCGRGHTWPWTHAQVKTRPSPSSSPSSSGIITIIIITERDNFITQHLSRRHIVYRDLKPANILLDEHGEYQPEHKYLQPWALDLFVFLSPESHNFIHNVLLVGKLIFPIAGHVRISDLGLACDFRFAFNMPLNACIFGL